MYLVSVKSTPHSFCLVVSMSTTMLTLYYFIHLIKMITQGCVGCWFLLTLIKKERKEQRRKDQTAVIDDGKGTY